MVILNIIWPTFAMVALIFGVWLTLVVSRFRHMKAVPPTADDFATKEASARYFQPAAQPGANLINLFEMPVLFFVLVPLLLITGHAGHVQVLLAWAFVLLRAAHSAIHIGPNKVMARFIVYLLSVIVLSAMWVGFFADMVAAAQAYSAAMATVAG